MENEAKTILVVDDIPENLELLADILCPQYTVLLALDGGRALALAQSAEPPDLILLDLMMPDFDGFEVCRRLKADSGTRNIPIIFVTARQEEYDEVQGFSVGAADFITKPLKPLTVKARVKLQLQLRSNLVELELQNQILLENAVLREQVEWINRHDLKSPLTAIINIPEMLVEGRNLTPEQKELLEALQKSGLRMLEMIDRSLNLCKMEKGLYQFKPVPVDLTKGIRQIFTELKGLARKRKVRLCLMVNGCPAQPDDAFVVPGEKLLFFSMLGNLTKNAIEASPDDEQVTVDLLSGSEYVIEIRTRGLVPKEIQARFFERFATSGKEFGTGLGNYSSRLAARTMGGDISFISNSEVGTVVTVTFPGAR